MLDFLHKLTPGKVQIKAINGVFPELTSDQLQEIVKNYKLFEIGDRATMTAKQRSRILAEIVNAYNTLIAEFAEEDEIVTDISIMEYFMGRIVYQETTVDDETQDWMRAWMYHVVVLDLFDVTMKDVAKTNG